MVNEEDRKVSPIAADILLPFAAELEQVSNSLNGTSFRHVWQSVFALVDKALFSELVLKTFFSSFGCQQFVHDISRGLIPIFGQYTKCPSNFCPFISDVTTLFSLSKGNFLLLKDHVELVVSGKSSEQEIERVCEEHKLSALTNFSELMKVMQRVVV